MTVIFNSTYSDQPKETPEPSATSASMFGARCRSERLPEMKKARLIAMMMRASSI